MLGGTPATPPTCTTLSLYGSPSGTEGATKDGIFLGRDRAAARGLYRRCVSK